MRTGKIVRIGKERTVRIIRKWRPTGVRRIGRQRLRREDGVRGFVGGMTIQNLSKMAMDR